MKWIVITLMCGVIVGTAAPAPDKPEGNRYLFVFENSSAMARLEHGGRQAVFDLIYSGIEGRMRPGDSFALWTFQEDVSIGNFPLQLWDADDKLGLASRAGVYLKQAPYKGKGSLSTALTRVMALVRGVKDVNVIFVCTAAAQVEELGPFPLWDQKKAQAKKMKKPLIMTLASRRGDIVQRSVALEGEPLQLPEPPPELVTVEPPPPAPVEAPVKVPRENIIMHAPPKRAAAPIETAVLVPVTNDAVVLQNTTDTNIAAVAQAASSTPPPSSVEPAAKQPDAFASLLPDPIPVAAREQAVGAPRAVPTTLATVSYARDRGLNPTALMLAGAGLLAVGLTIGAWLLISSRKGPELSSISQSMSRVRLTR